MSTRTLTIRKPDDWHLHLRDGAMLRACLPETARHFARAIIMPNLVPPVTTTAAAIAYRERIMAALPAGMSFQPLMTCYLTDGIDPDEIERGHKSGTWVAAKLYPAHATTNSHFGVTSLDTIAAALARMEKIGMPVLLHGEVTRADVDIFDREAVFVETTLVELRRRYPGLKIVLEHVTTEEGASFVAEAGPLTAGTITPHHLVINRNAMFAGGLRPHHYCLPVPKRERHRLALRKAATSGSRSFFLGTDSAPHPVHAKEQDCGCAGIFNATTAVQTYAQVFAEDGALDKFEAFASLNGPAFYGLAPNEEKVTLTEIAGDAVKAPEGPTRLKVEGTTDEIMIFGADRSWSWQVAG